MSSKLAVRFDGEISGEGHCITMKIIEQDLEDFFVHTGTFKASNGWTVRSVLFPEIRPANKQIYLRGTYEEDATRECIVTPDAFPEIVVAINELITAAKRFDADMETTKAKNTPPKTDGAKSEACNEVAISTECRVITIE